MSLSGLQKRITKLETGMKHAWERVVPSRFQNYSTADWLQEIADATWWIKERAEAVGDYRTALACLRSLHPLVEFGAKLRGELDERSQTNVLNLNVDPATARRIAETYLARHSSVQGDSECQG